MGKFEKLLKKILAGSSDNNIRFDELCSLLLRLSFRTRIKESHHIFFRDDIEEIINIQPNNDKAKAYQIKQVRNIIVKYKLIQDENKI